MSVLYDQVDPDDDQGLPEEGSPEDNANLLCGLAMIQAERLAAATSAVQERWWRLCMNTDPARFLRLDRRYQMAGQSQRFFIRELAKTLRNARAEVSPEQYGRVHAATKELVDHAHRSAGERVRGMYLSN